MADIDTRNISSSSKPSSYSGLSGNLPFDANELVGKLVEAQRQPMAKIEQQQQTIDAHETLLQTVSSKLHTFSECARSMESLGRLLVQHAESSAPTVIKASAGEGAKAGAYSVEVKTLAAAERRMSRPLPDPNEADVLGAGTLSWQDGDARVEVPIDAQTTLSSLSGAINRERRGIHASVVYDGQSYRLSVRSDATGKQAAMGLCDDVGLQLADAASLVQPAEDATFVVDGVIPMTRPTNVVSDAIEGLTLKFDAKDTRATIVVSPDVASLLEKVAVFVDGYNGVRQAVDEAAKPTKDFDRERLVGDSTLRNMIDGLQRIITSPIEGAPDGMRSLAALGVTSDREGRLSVDTTRLVSIGSERPEDVARLFARDPHRNGRGLAQAAAKLCDQYGAPMTGALSLKLAAITRQRSAHDARLLHMQGNLDRYEQTTRQKFTDLERNMTMMKSQNEQLQQQMKSLQRRD